MQTGPRGYSASIPGTNSPYSSSWPGNPPQRVEAEWRPKSTRCARCGAGAWIRSPSGANAFRESRRGLAARSISYTGSEPLLDIYHSDGITRDVYWQMLGERSETDTFQCLAWLYDAFPAQPATEQSD